MAEENYPTLPFCRKYCVTSAASTLGNIIGNSIGRSGEVKSSLLNRIKDERKNNCDRNCNLVKFFKNHPDILETVKRLYPESEIVKSLFL